MKIYNPNDLDFDPQTLRALARGDLDPVRLAVDQHQQQKSQEIAPRKTRVKRRVSDKQALAKTQIVARPSDLNKSADSRTPESTPKKPSAEERLAERDILLVNRRKLAQIIRDCEALEVLNYELLAMKYYPGGAAIAAAKRRRDIWILCCVFCSSVVLVGWHGFLSPWITGVMFGLLVILLAFCLEPFRRLFYKVPSLAQLKAMRKAMEFRALNHVKMLEGSHGLALHCKKMTGYNPVLADKRFKRLVFLSKRGSVVKGIQSVAGIRLYLIYVMEAQKAFAIVKQRYMETSSKLNSDYVDLVTE